MRAHASRALPAAHLEGAAPARATPARTAQRAAACRLRGRAGAHPLTGRTGRRRSGRIELLTRAPRCCGVIWARRVRQRGLSVLRARRSAHDRRGRAHRSCAGSWRGHPKVSSCARLPPMKCRSGNWNTAPTRRARSAAGVCPLGCPFGSAPPTCTLPLLGSHRPASSVSSVVLPLPLRPVGFKRGELRATNCKAQGAEKRLRAHTQTHRPTAPGRCAAGKATRGAGA